MKNVNIRYSEARGSYEQYFWKNNNKYQDLAESFERNIQLKHPGSVTSKGMCPCLKYVSWCGWAASSVKYYEYNGPRV